MEELLRLLALQQGASFPEHGMQVGDRVRMVDVSKHKFQDAEKLMLDGEEGTVVHTELFLGMMPVFEVRPDAGREVDYGDERIDVVPFGNEADFSSVIKIEE